MFIQLSFILITTTSCKQHTDLPFLFRMNLAVFQQQSEQKVFIAPLIFIHVLTQLIKTESKLHPESVLGKVHLNAQILNLASQVMAISLFTDFNKKIRNAYRKKKSKAEPYLCKQSGAWFSRVQYCLTNSRPTSRGLGFSITISLVN